MTTPTPTSPGRVDGYSALRDYAAIGDGRTVAMIARDGRVDWFPIPALDTPPLFAALIDEQHGGRIELCPTAPFTTDRHYVAGTNVLVTRFTTDTGVVDVTDALVTGVAGRLPWTELARRIEGIEGAVELTWSVQPGDALDRDRVQRFDTGHGPLIRCGSVNIVLVGFEHGRTDPVHPGNGPAQAPPEFRGRFTTAPGSRHLICLCGTQDEPVRLPDPHVVDQGIDRTIAGWERWSQEFTWDGPWPEAVARSALALKLLIYSPTGAIAAAATTSLPESLSGGKNYDYRFAWIRDAAYTVDALIRFGLREEPHGAVSWMLKALKAVDGDMAVFLTLDGERRDEIVRSSAPGWRGIGPVLIGNSASRQLQLGTYADLLSIVASYAAGGNVVDGTTSDLLVKLANDACVRWPKKDAGMWELPVKRHYVSSKMGCWQALDAILRLHDMGLVLPKPGDRARWEKNRRLIRRWIDRHGWSERRGAYVMAKGSRDLDTSVLLHTVSGFDRGERMSRTIDVLRRELGAGDLIYRYSGMEREEGTFTACAFWTASALACVGRTAEATELMDRLVAQVNDVGLLTEMIDADTGAFLGNLPQALSHLALVNAASVIRTLS